jgi:hypothetical protein
MIFFLAGLKLLPYLTLESPLLSYLILYGKASSIMYSFIKQNLKNPANVALLYLCLLPLLDKFVNELNGIILLSRSLYMRQSATSGKAGGLQKVEPLKADRCCEPLKAVRL